MASVEIHIPGIRKDPGAPGEYKRDTEKRRYVDYKVANIGNFGDEYVTEPPSFEKYTTFFTFAPLIRHPST